MRLYVFVLLLHDMCGMKLVQRRDSNSVDTVYGPCNYPVPGTGFRQDLDFTQACWRYVAIDYVCDVDMVLSRTEAERIDFVLKNTSVFASQQVSIGIAILRQLVVPERLSMFRPLNSKEDVSWFCDNVDTAHSIPMNFNATMYRRLFAHVLQHRWFQNPCTDHALFLYVHEGVYAKDGQLLRKGPQFLVSLSETLSVKVDASHDIEARAMEAYSRSLAMGDLLIRALNEVSNSYALWTAAHPTSEQDGHIPMWAWYTVMGCTALIITLVVLDWTIVRKKASVYKLGAHNPNRGRWIAGPPIASSYRKE